MTYRLFDANQPSADKHESSKEEILANKLLNGLRHRKKLVRKPNLTQWAEDMRRLTAKENDVEIVMDWFLQHVDDDDMPEILSARGFRDKYHRVKALWLHDPSGIVISDQAKDVAARTLKENPWPRKVARHMEVIVQRSMDSYTAFWKIVEERRAGLNDKDTRLLNYLVKERFFFDDARSFVRYMWMRYLWEHYGYRDYIPINELIFDVRFIMECGEDAAYAYSGQDRRFEQLMSNFK